MSSSAKEKTYDSDGFSENEDVPESHLDFIYKNAVINIRKNSSKYAKDDLLYFYARYKFITEGDCNTKRPSFIQIEAKKKWEAWNSLKKDFPGLTPDQAKNQYCERLDKISCGWRNGLDSGDKFNKADEGGTFGVRMSAMKTDENELNESEKTCFDLCKEGSLTGLEAFLKKHSNKGDINQTDENRMTMLMWACDRGNLELVQYLVNKKADLNMQDADGQTCLHYAASCEHANIVKLLLSNKSLKRDLLDSEGLRASESTNNKEITALFN